MNAAVRRPAFLLFLVAGAACANTAPEVVLGGDPPLSARFFPPAQAAAPAPAVVFMHGCGGAFGRGGALAARFRAWSSHLNERGYAVLVVDSFTGRGLRELCTQPTAERALKPAERATDAWRARDWLAARGDVDASKIALMGWSNGGTTSLHVARQAPAGQAPFAAVVALYPGCGPLAKEVEAYRPRSPLLVLIGEDDDWTPATACRELSARAPEIVLKTYPGAVHGFDDPAGRVRVRTDVPGGRHPGRGVTVGPHPGARADAFVRVTEFLAGHLR